MFDVKGRFIIENYNKKTEFSSFLPGISGTNGIPLWSFYVNRGQAIASFGSFNKEHSIMEFYPAHQSYELTKTLGFRTFLKVDDSFYEPFRGNNAVTKMYIGINELEIEETIKELGIRINILYYIMPEESIGGLVRQVSIINLENRDKRIEMLDGMPAIIPYGIGLTDFKAMAQTMKAWMQVEDNEKNIPYYRVRYSTKDSATVTKVSEGNYFLATEYGKLLPVISDAAAVFDYDTSFDEPVNFQNNGIECIISKKQNLQNQVPSAFAAYKTIIKANCVNQITEIIGQAATKELLSDLKAKCLQKDFFDNKHKRAVELTKDLSSVISTKTGNKVFDEYCRQTFVDNVLRGGSPINLGKDNIFYVYSRKHGDLERDYNFFRMPAEYYSQGNGNYRDVNQNRRCDVMFYPDTMDYNIKLFYNLIQLDGYNPLVIQPVTYFLEKPECILEYVSDKNKAFAVREFFKEEFTPGGLIRFIEKEKVDLIISNENLLERAISAADLKINAEFTEGYWTDHWTYNLDLVEAYLAVYPEKEKALLFDDYSYCYYQSKAVVLPRSKRYVKTDDGVRQYNFLDDNIKEAIKHKYVRTEYGKGTEYNSNLFTKLIILAINKFATLDMCGMGIEMEGGKPGWYDALNGMPSIFGSAMTETYELKRMLLFMRDIQKKYKEEVRVPLEAYEFFEAINKTNLEHKNNPKDKLCVWNELNLAKEEYREKTIFGIDGKESIISYEELIKKIDEWISYIDDGISCALDNNGGIAPTYFRYEIENYEDNGSEISFTNLKRVRMPDFLEGSVRYMKLIELKDKKRVVYETIKKSNMYDSELKMYKVNESLVRAPFEAGRAKAFCAGWLENESIWLHMEYKYLLELLKNGLHKEFIEDFQNACVAFLDYEKYGRSPLENVSFIASSANQNESIRGRGFVARLSGSTAEFLHIWNIMMFGIKPIQIVDGKLCAKFEPTIPEYLLDKKNIIEATFAGKITVKYYMNESKTYVPSQYQVIKQIVYYSDGRKVEYKEYLPQLVVEAIRNEEIERIEVYLE